jgi:hypothetical protein
MMNEAVSQSASNISFLAILIGFQPSKSAQQATR